MSILPQLQAADELVKHEGRYAGAAIIKNPGEEAFNKTSEDIEKIIKEKLVRVYPGRNNPEKIWKRVSSGSLKSKGNLYTCYLILKNRTLMQDFIIQCT